MASAPQPQPAQLGPNANTTTPDIRYLPTTEAYNKWAQVYDHDGNFLQQLDTHEMQTLLPSLVILLDDRPKPWKVIDLGCGTGRNTMALLDRDDGRADIVAVDASPGMLEIAKQKAASRSAENPREGSVDFAVLDLLSNDPLPHSLLDADAAMSTLVLEHIPCDTFFRKAAQMLKPGGLFLMTNMHSEMGNISQAGFVDPITGQKIRPTSYAHTVEDVRVTARTYGFVIEEEIKEVAVREEDVARLGARAKKWIGIKCWYGGILRKTDGCH